MYQTEPISEAVMFSLAAGEGTVSQVSCAARKTDARSPEGWGSDEAGAVVDQLVVSGSWQKGWSSSSTVELLRLRLSQLPGGGSSTAL